MSALNVRTLNSRVIKYRQHGVAAVEFSLVAIGFFVYIFGVMELARFMYVANTLQEVTRRAAVAATNADFRDTGWVREHAIFRDGDGPGELLLAAPVTDQHVRIDYLALDNTGGNTTLKEIPAGNLPANPAKNRAICNANPNATNCIRLVRARICEPNGNGGCVPVNYRSIFPMTQWFSIAELPIATTIMPAQSLGYAPPSCTACAAGP